ncbi:MAG: tubulin-like doman-containing protein [Pirellula sp.]
MAATATTSIQAGFEPIPGYVLREKIGVGGYGEVWLADAPGGLKKAIKFVHGNIDEDRASNELKSLQRIRQVNHPFILSLERIEIIHGQLVIVTELAQGSLHERFLEFRTKGFVGITRDRLLGYLRDAADGLDFLCQQHDLQHLDVKPANLLLIADRVKVADFGLIKDIQSNSLSIMGGLTPTYAAPEMFDGRPGRFSDQYSLAIVYQELLTGTLPFRGRTTAQLANEHLHKAPNLEAVPLLERPILSKALAKKPQLRFSDCKEFISAIERVGKHERPLENSQENDVRIKPRHVSKGNNKFEQKKSPLPGNFAKRSRLEQDTPNQVTESASGFHRASRTVETLPELLEMNPMGDNASTSSAGASSTYQKKNLVIGIGQTGADAILAYRRRILESNKPLDTNENRGYLLFDSDQSAIQRAIAPDRDERMSYHSTVHIPLKSPQYYRALTTSTYSQISRRWVYNIPRSLKTEGVRPLGMLAFLDNANAVFEAIQDTIVEIARSHGTEQCHEAISVQIVGSAHGGTGSAMFCEVGFLVRQLAAEFELPINIELIITCATANGVASTDLATASAIACLTEINHYFKTEGLHPAIEHLPPSHAVNQPPFDRVVLVYGGQCGNQADWIAAITQTADYLWSITETELGDRIANTWESDQKSQTEATDIEWSTWLSTMNARQVEVNTKVEPEVTASRICLRAVLPWVSALTAQLNDHRAGQNSASQSESKISEQMDFFVSDMFRSNQWTAQAWVHQCMVCLLPEVREIETTSENAEPLEERSIRDLESILTIDEKQELLVICEQLALESTHANRLVADLVVTTRAKLVDWIVGKWIANPVSFANLRQLLRLVSVKFGVNANSLRVVAEKLSEKHDAILEQLYNGSLKSSPELDNQLHATALEARFHSMAERMLSRLAEHMSFLEDLWAKECVYLNKDLCDWGMELAKRLGIPWDNSSSSQSALMSLARCEQDDAITKKARKSLLELASCRLASGFGVDFDCSTSFHNPDLEPISLDNIFDRLVHETENSSPTSRSMANATVALSPETELGSLPPNTEVTPRKSSSTGSSLTRGIVQSNGQVSLVHEIEASRPYLVEFGGAVRSAIVMPAWLKAQLEPMQMRELSEKQIAVVENEQCKMSSIVCIGERLILKDIMDRVWMPSSDIWQLSHRLLARVDVDWQQVNS